MVSSALYLAEDGRLFVTFRSPHLHDPRRAQSLAGRGEPPGRPGTRGPYQPGHDATLHRGRYRGQTQARGAAVNAWCRGVQTASRPGAAVLLRSWLPVVMEP